MLIRDRIRELRRVPAANLRPNPRNWRTHPVAQRAALRGLLAEIGYADALLVRELADGTLLLVDGHLRAETTPDAVVPVLVLDLDEQEADKLLLTLDPLAALATQSDEQLAALVAQTEFESEAVQALVARLAHPGEPPTPPALAELTGASYQVVVECDSEQDQHTVYEQMRSEGYRCRVLTL